MNTPETLFTDSEWSAPALKGNGTVMLVDDEPAVRTIGKAILSTLPYGVVDAHSGEDAIEKLNALIKAGNCPSIIILDLTMPGGMSGLETLAEIRKLDPKIGIIACSGFFEQSAHDLCCALGFMEIIEKPYTSEVLTSTVRKCMARVAEGDIGAPAPEPAAAVSPFAIPDLA